MDRFFFFFLLLILFNQKIYAQSNAAAANNLYNQVSDILEKPALPNLEKAIDLCRNGQCADTTLAKFYRRLGVIYFNDYISDKLALAYTDTAILLYERSLGRENFYTAESYFNKGVFQSILEDFKRARENVELATAILDRIEVPKKLDKDSVRFAWNETLGVIFKEGGDFFMASSLYANLLKLPGITKPERIGVLNSISLLELDRGNYQESVSTLRRILSQASITDLDRSYYGGNLGFAYLLLNNNLLAEKYLIESLAYRNDILKNRTDEIQSLTKFKELISNSHANLLQLYLQKQEYGKAEYHYTEALRLLLEVDSTSHLPRFAEIYLRKGKLEHALGNYNSSLFFLERAMQVVAPELKTTGIDEKISIIGPFKRVVELIGFRARVLASQGEEQRALQDVALLNRLITQSRRSYHSSLSKYYLIGQVMPIYELGIQLNYRLYQQTRDPQYLKEAYAYNARNKAILLLESIQSDRAMTFAKLSLSVQEEEKALRDELIEQERLLYVAYQKEAPTDSLQSMVFEREQQYNQFIQQLEKDYPAYYDLKYGADRPPAIADIQRQLESDQVLLEYFVGEDSLYTFFFGGNELQVFTAPTPPGLIDSVALFRELISNGIERDCQKTFISLGRFFHDLLLAQPLARLRAQQNRLVIVPDGLLNYLSFEAFIYKPLAQFNGPEGFLIEKYACSYAYSSKLLTEKDYYPRSATKGFAGFGTEYDDATLRYLQEIGFTGVEEVDTTLILPCGHAIKNTRYLGPLSFSDDEVRNIAAITKGDTWLNEEVTKNNFLQVAKDYNLLHLSMHGTYNLEFPMNSSLIFTHTDSSEVFLRAGEIYGLELTGEMAVLSACNTGYGKLETGEGPMTMARAFHYAGIPAVVASLWSIPDNSSSRIMKLFYEQLAKGLPKDIALQRAKLAYMSDDDLSSPATRQPIHWAPMIVVGSVESVQIGSGSRWVVWLALSVTALGIMLVFMSRKKG